MSEIEFDNGEFSQSPHILYSRFQASSDKPKVVNWLLKTRIAKTENQANYILLGVFIILMIASIFLFVFALKSNDQSNTREEKVKKMEEVSKNNYE